MSRIGVIIVLGVIGLVSWRWVAAGTENEGEVGGVRAAEVAMEAGREQLRLSFWVVNDTEVMVRPDVGIVVTDMWGDKMVDIRVKDEIVLEPGEEQLLTAEWKSTATVIGRMRTDIEVAEGGSRNRTEANFWLFPQSLNVAAIGASLLATGRVSNWVLTRLA